MTTLNNIYSTFDGHIRTRGQPADMVEEWRLIFDVVFRIIDNSTTFDGVYVNDVPYWGGEPYPHCNVTTVDSLYPLDSCQRFRINATMDMAVTIDSACRADDAGIDCDSDEDTMHQLLTTTGPRSLLDQCSRHVYLHGGNTGYGMDRLQQQLPAELAERVADVAHAFWSRRFPQITRLHLYNDSGDNLDRRGRDYMVNANGQHVPDIIVPSQYQQTLENAEGVTMLELVRAFYLLRSHHFEKWYELFSGVDAVNVKKDGALELVFQPDHGS